MSKQSDKFEYVVSTRLADGTLAESVQLPDGATALAVARAGEVTLVERLQDGDVTLLPIPARNNLIRHRVVLLPPPPEASGNPSELIADLSAFIARYVTLSEPFLVTAVHYVLLSWVYDAFRELPYLRVRGDYGSGKTRALQVIGTLLYKPIFASGATTVSPIFHTLDLFRGSLVLDEADFRFSDQTAELTKILNNGNAVGFPVLRSVPNDKKLYDPRAFAVFGPKLVAMREFFRDPALESRFLTETMGRVPPAKGIPLSLPESFADQATVLRSKLLAYRFATLPKITVPTATVEPGLTHRTQQILAPLLAFATTAEDRRTMVALARAQERDTMASMAFRPESYVLGAIAALFAAQAGSIQLADVRRYLARHNGSEFDRPITARYVGHLVRARLNLPTKKSHGTFKVLVSEERLAALLSRFGVDKVDEVDIGEIG